MQEPDLAPNHHADYPGFSGLFGLVAAMSMTRGRSDDARLALRLSAVAPGETVVDIGCGPGAAARQAARLGATVVAVDPAAVMLRVARLMTFGAKVSYRRGAAESLPVDDRFASVVWSLSTVHHWRDLDAGLREVRRVLVPNGRFVAIEHHVEPSAHRYASHGWTADQAAAFAAKCVEFGFTDARVEEHPEVHRPAISVTVTTS
jgi:ubiquinone/menaquinone biosynthesis C-methylase UbiE